MYGPVRLHNGERAEVMVNAARRRLVGRSMSPSAARAAKHRHRRRAPPSARRASLESVFRNEARFTRRHLTRPSVVGPLPFDPNESRARVDGVHGPSGNAPIEQRCHGQFIRIRIHRHLTQHTRPAVELVPVGENLTRPPSLKERISSRPDCPPAASFSSRRCSTSGRSRPRTRLRATTSAPRPCRPLVNPIPVKVILKTSVAAGGRDSRGSDSGAWPHRRRRQTRSEKANTVRPAGTSTRGV